MFVAFLISLASIADEPVAVVPPPVITRLPPAQGAGPDGVQNLVSLFSTDDYPSDAVRNEEEGTTEVRMMVTTEGRVGNCEVVSSSGSQTLDRATCDILQRRARFKPALDRQGRPTIDYYTQRVRWELPDDPTPFADWTDRMEVQFDAAGRVTSCRYYFGNQSSDNPNCDGFISLARLRTGDRPDVLNRPHSFVVERRFEANPKGSATPIGEGPDKILIGRDEAEFEVDAAGHLRNCRVTVRQGTHFPRDLCEHPFHVELEPVASDAPGPRRGRSTAVSYLKR